MKDETIKRNIPNACPICAGPCEMQPGQKGSMIVWQCGISKELFRLIVYEKEREEE